MASRMERYYKSEGSSQKRSQMNKKLYDTIYEESEYSNIEAVATMSKPDEIDIAKIKQMLKNREDYKKQKQYRQIMNHPEIKKEPSPTIQMEEVKNYDVKELLSKAKSEVEDSEYRRLDNTNYNILKELKIHKEKEADEDSNNLKEMINTITNTSLLHKLDDQELGLDMLSDLKGNDDTLIGEESNTIRALIEEAKKEETKDEDTKDEIDTSFYSASMNFNKKDFMDFDNERTNFFHSIWFKVLLGLLILVAVVIAIVVFVL